MSRALWIGVLAFAGGASAFAQTVEWPATTPERAGLDRAKLDAWRDVLAKSGTTGLLVIRRGAIAYEWYAAGWGPDKPHGTASMAKALVGGMSLLVASSDGADLAGRPGIQVHSGVERRSAEVEDHDPAAGDTHLRHRGRRAGRHCRTTTSRLEGRLLAARARPVLHRRAPGAGAVRAGNAQCVQQSRDGGAVVCHDREPQGRRRPVAAEDAHHRPARDSGERLVDRLWPRVRSRRPAAVRQLGRRQLSRRAPRRGSAHC